MDAARGVVRLVALIRRHDADLIHARSYLPAAMAAVAGFLTRRPFIFDMRGFLGDEYVESEHWKVRSARYLLLRVAEKILLRGAAEVVVLTEQADQRLRAMPAYAPHVRGKPITVVRCVVDLDRFYPVADRDPLPTLVYSGSLGTWYLLDEMLRVYARAREHLPALRMVLFNRTEHELIRRGVRAHAIPEGSVEIRAADPEEMPRLLARAHVGIALLRQVPSKLASSAVKVAEYLASGLPVIVNTGHGDIDDLVRRYGAGHVMGSYSDEEIRRAGRAVAQLVSDPVARSNARRLAEDEYDLRDGIDRYDAIYRRLTAARSNATECRDREG